MMADDSDFDFERLELKLDRIQLRHDPEGTRNWMDNLHTRFRRHHHSLPPAADTRVQFPSDMHDARAVPDSALSPRAYVSLWNFGLAQTVVAHG